MVLVGIIKCDVRQDVAEFTRELRKQYDEVYSGVLDPMMKGV